jgi:hypothetical protein
MPLLARYIEEFRNTSYMHYLVNQSLIHIRYPCIRHPKILNPVPDRLELNNIESNIKKYSRLILKSVIYPVVQIIIPILFP